MNDHEILPTGAIGFLGGALLARLLAADRARPPPRFTDYAGVCARTSAHIKIAGQMHWNFT